MTAGWRRLWGRCEGDWARGSCGLGTPAFTGGGTDVCQALGFGSLNPCPHASPLPTPPPPLQASRYAGNPVQLLNATEFLHNEQVFIAWLSMAIAISGSALLLLAFSAMAHYNPMTHPEIHVAEVPYARRRPRPCTHGRAGTEAGRTPGDLTCLEEQGHACARV